MARKAVLALACLAIAATAAITGCTWAETQRDYPPSMRQQAHNHDHGHGHALDR